MNLKLVLSYLIVTLTVRRLPNHHHSSGAIRRYRSGRPSTADRRHHEDPASRLLHQEQVHQGGGFSVQGVLGPHSEQRENHLSI